MKWKFAISALAFSLLVANADAREREHPGPGLWKVSHGEHVLYVFGKYGPLPKGMQWRSQEVESILAQSQEYLTAPAFATKPGTFGGLQNVASVAQLFTLMNNPDDASLQSVVPHETYTRWLALKKRYLLDNKWLDKHRPIVASQALFHAGLEEAGLSRHDLVDGVIQKLVKQSNVKVTASSIEGDLPEAGQMIKDFHASGQNEAACFATAMAALEADIEQMRLRADTWAAGAIEPIRKLGFVDPEGSCRNEVGGNAYSQSSPALAATRANAHALWLANAEKALANNASTFAVLRMNDILSPTGLIAALEAKGYKIESPE